MTIVQVPCNTELRSMPFARKAGYSPYRTLMDSVGRVQNMSIFGDQQVGERHHDISMSFYLGRFLDETLENIVGGGTITDDDAQLTLSTFTAGDEVEFQTRNAIIHQAGFDAQAMFSVAFSIYTGTDAVVEQSIGVFDGSDGWTISAKGDQLSVAYFSKGTMVAEVIQADFNLDKVDGSGVSGFKVVIDHLNMFRVQYTLGILPTTFEIWGGAQSGWLPIHTVDLVNQFSDIPLIQNPHLPIRIISKVISGTPDIPIVVRTGGLYGGTFGGERSRADSTGFAVGNGADIPAQGTETGLMAIRNKTIFRGLTNQIRIDVSDISVTSDGNKSVFFNLYVEPIITGAVWVDVDTENSVVEVAKNNFTFNGGRYAGSILVNKVDSEYVQLDVAELRLNPDQILVIAGTSSSGSEIRCSMRWGELR